MRLLLSITFLLLNYNISIGQVVIDLPTAKSIALAENKLIIINFCDLCSRRCIEMDQEIWNTQRFEKLKDRFVLARIDKEQNRRLAELYQVLGTPRVFIQTANDDILLDERFDFEPLYFMHLLESFPTDYEEINNKSLVLIDKDVTPTELYELGEAFRATGLKTDNKTIRNAFLAKSKMYYKKTEKASESIELKQISTLSQLRIEAYKGKIQKVKKKLINFSFRTASAKVTEMADFLTAYCYKSEGDINGMLGIKEKIKDPALLKELESNIKRE